MFLAFLCIFAKNDTLMWDGSLKIQLFYWFLAPFLLEAVEGAQHQKNKN
jgi:hypothetical protein